MTYLTVHFVISSAYRYSYCLYHQINLWPDFVGRSGRAGFNLPSLNEDFASVLDLRAGRLSSCGMGLWLACYGRAPSVFSLLQSKPARTLIAFLSVGQTFCYILDISSFIEHSFSSVAITGNPGHPYVIATGHEYIPIGIIWLLLDSASMICIKVGITSGGDRPVAGQ